MIKYTSNIKDVSTPIYEITIVFNKPLKVYSTPIYVKNQNLDPTFFYHKLEKTLRKVCQNFYENSSESVNMRTDEEYRVVSGFRIITPRDDLDVDRLIKLCEKFTFYCVNDVLEKYNDLCTYTGEGEKLPIHYDNWVKPPLIN
jgi:hypothetical protein